MILSILGKCSELLHVQEGCDAQVVPQCSRQDGLSGKCLFTTVSHYLTLSTLGQRQVRQSK